MELRLILICRFNRRSPDRNFNRGQRNFNRFNRSRSRSIDRRRRRRSRSESPARTNNNSNAAYGQQQLYGGDGGYANYIPNPPGAPQFGYGYDYQGTAYPPPPPAFTGIDCPAPPGLTEGWVPPPGIQPEENEEEKSKREGKQLMNS